MQAKHQMEQSNATPAGLPLRPWTTIMLACQTQSSQAPHFVSRHSRLNMHTPIRVAS
jgi:hypothetical protein